MQCMEIQEKVKSRNCSELCECSWFQVSSGSVNSEKSLMGENYAAGFSAPSVFQG